MELSAKDMASSVVLVDTPWGTHYECHRDHMEHIGNTGFRNALCGGHMVFSIPFAWSPLQFFEKEYQLISVYHYPKSSSHL